jgi:3D (Asp-Asp-Asp) domain-containing protein
LTFWRSDVRPRLLVAVLALAWCGAAYGMTARQHLRHAERAAASARSTLRFFARRPQLLYSGPTARRRRAWRAVLRARSRLAGARRESYAARLRLAATRPYTALRVTATMYAPGCGDSGHGTATGTTPRLGTVAVDPAVIPLGSRLWVAGYGPARAEDTGGAIRGAHVDLWVPSCARAYTRYGVLVKVFRD